MARRSEGWDSMIIRRSRTRRQQREERSDEGVTEQEARECHTAGHTMQAVTMLLSEKPPLWMECGAFSCSCVQLPILLCSKDSASQSAAKK
jgi:hypothetical protein